MVNGRVLLLLSPLLGLLAGLAALGALGDPAGRPAVLLFALSLVAVLGLGVAVPEVRVKKNRLAGPLGFYLLAAFSVLVVVAITIDVLALLALFGVIEPELAPSYLWGVWALCSLLLALQAGVVLERRINAPRPHLGPVVVLIVGLITAFDLVLWGNALLVDRAPFLFVTPFQLFTGQAVYLLLTGATFQAVGLMILFRIPTIFELVFRRRAAAGRMVALTRASPLLFSLAFTGLVFVGTFSFAIAADRLFSLGRVLPGGAGTRLLVAFPVALLTFFGVAGFLAYQRTRTTYRHKMEAHHKVALGVSIGSAVVTIALLFLAYRLSRGDDATFGGVFIPSAAWPEAFVLGLLAATGPVGFYLQSQQRKIQLTEEWLSDFLRDMAETAKAGLPLHQALRTSVDKDYGPLTAEIHRMSVQCSWGLSFPEAFRRFGERSRSRLVRRAAYLVVESSIAGGNTGDVLAATALDIHQQKALDEDRRGAMTTYIAVIYVVFFVFMSVLAALSALFLPKLLGATQAASEAGASTALFSGSRINLQAVKETYFHALLVQALGNGVVAGLIRDASVGAGLKHVFILVILAYAAFRFMFG